MRSYIKKIKNRFVAVTPVYPNGMTIKQWERKTRKNTRKIKRINMCIKISKWLNEKRYTLNTIILVSCVAFVISHLLCMYFFSLN